MAWGAFLLSLQKGGETMRKLTIVAILALLVGLMTSAIIGTAVVMAGHGDEAAVGLLGNEVTTEGSKGHLISAGGDGRNAGLVASATGEIDGLDEGTVEVSTSWDWGPPGQYRNPSTGEATVDSVELEVHPCALVNTTDHTFTDAQSLTGPFTTTATVTITDENGDEIFGKIVGGTNCELYDASNVYTGVNEGLTSFEITGGTGEFASASGTGLIRLLFDFTIAPSGAFTLSEIFLHLDELDDEDDEDGED